MTGRKRSLATRRKKEEKTMQNDTIIISKELIATVTIVIMVAVFLKGLIFGYFVGKNS